MNIVKNIEIRNFKSIRHAKIEDCRRINVFVGYPNTGKSNILEALSLFSVNEQTDLKSLIRVKEVPTIFFNGFISEDIMVALNDEFICFGNYAENTFSLQYQTEVAGLPEEHLRLNPVMSPYSVLKKLNYSQNFENHPGVQVFNEKVTSNYVIKKYEFGKNIQNTATNYSSLQYPFGNNIFSILRTNKELNKDVEDLFKEYNLEFLYDSREQKYTILKRTKTGIFTVPYELVADTLQRLIFFKSAIYSNQGRILVFEEPEAHMFPPYISKFTSDIWYFKDNQYFISTQSPFVLNDFLENTKDDLAIYAVEYNKIIGETNIKRLTEDQVHEAYQYGIDIFFNLESITK